MNAKPIKIAATVVVLTLGFAGLLYSTLRDGTEYYKHVDEVMTQPSEWQGKRLQLHGFIVDGSILQKPDTLQYRFQVQNNGKIVQADAVCRSGPFRRCQPAPPCGRRQRARRPEAS